jgi:hypothetical protein
MEELVQDLRYSLRMFRKSPLVTAAAVFSLAVGIGANTAMFSWLDGLVLSPLRVQEPEQLVHLYSTDRSGFRGAYSYFHNRSDDCASVSVRQGLEEGEELPMELLGAIDVAGVARALEDHALRVLEHRHERVRLLHRNDLVLLAPDNESRYFHFLQKAEISIAPRGGDGDEPYHFLG